MKSEYFEEELPTPFNIKKEPSDNIKLKEEPVTHIKDLYEEYPDIELEFQKITSGIDFLNTLLQGKFKDETFKVKDENKYLTMLENMEEKIMNTKKLLTEMYEMRLKNILKLESITEKISDLRMSLTNIEHQNILTEIQNFYQNVLNYNCETQENIIRDNWKPRNFRKPETIRKFWSKIKKEAKITEIDLKSYDDTMENIVDYIEVSISDDIEKCICKSEDEDMIWLRHKLCSAGAATIDKYCEIHIGTVILSEPHWKNCGVCLEVFEKKKERSHNLIWTKKDAIEDVLERSQMKRKFSIINHIKKTQRKKLRYERNYNTDYFENVANTSLLHPTNNASWYGEFPYPFFHN